MFITDQCIESGKIASAFWKAADPWIINSQGTWDSNFQNVLLWMMV